MKRLLLLFPLLLAACSPSDDELIYSIQTDIQTELEATFGEETIDFLSYDHGLIEETTNGYRVIGTVYVDSDELLHTTYTYYAQASADGDLEDFTLQQAEVVN